MLGAVLVYRLGDGAGLHAHGAAEQVYGIHPAHAREREHELAVLGHRASGESGAAARRNDRDLGGVTEAQQLRDLLGGARQRDRGRRGRVDPGPVSPVGVEVVLLAREEVGGKRLSELVEKMAAGGFGHDANGGLDHKMDGPGGEDYVAVREHERRAA